LTPKASPEYISRPLKPIPLQGTSPQPPQSHQGRHTQSTHRLAYAINPEAKRLIITVPNKDRHIPVYTRASYQTTRAIICIEQLELASGIATLDPLAGGYLIVRDDVHAEVVSGGTAGAVDELVASVTWFQPAGESPGGGDRGSGEEGEDGCELHFNLDLEMGCCFSTG